MSVEAPRRLSRAVLAVALAVPVLVAIWWFWSRPEPIRTSFDDALDRALAPVLEQRDVHTKLGVSTGARARPLARSLAQSSVTYSAPRDLELWASTREQAAHSSPIVCANLWKGSNDVAVGAAIAALGPEALQPYVEMLARAFAVRLERKPPPLASPGAIERGFAAVSATLPEPERSAFSDDIRRADVSDERACELFLTVSRGTAALEPAARIDFLRALSAQLKAAR